MSLMANPVQLTDTDIRWAVTEHPVILVKRRMFRKKTQRHLMWTWRGRKGLEAELRALGVRLHIVEARSSVRGKLRVEGLEDRIGRIDRFTSVADAVEGYLAP